MSRYFFAVHKNGITQTNIKPVGAFSGQFLDPLVTFHGAMINDTYNGVPLFDLERSRVQVPGLYQCVALSINVVNSRNGGKFYALVSRNNQPNIGSANDFSLLWPNRSYGNTDTVGTQVAGYFNLRYGSELRAADFATARIQISNVDASERFSLGSASYETYWHCERVGEPIDDEFPINEITPENIIKTSGMPTSVEVNSGFYLYCDLSYSVNPGTTVKSITFYASKQGSYSIFLLKRNSHTIFEKIRSRNIFHAAEGDCWQSFNIDPFTIPQDGFAYHVAVQTNGQTIKMFDLKPRACKSTPPENFNNMAVVDPAQPGYFVVGTGYGF